ncbi:unnamed protein product [Pleuronectes platessa]|uniref:Uncharacterized protein n=1 Tax=Pleuronectes platessa TaxID=8262 RepID=A0A9N7UGS2_PLEPL|nr:unnamed protein product [Pleuronectes platessa]
MQRVLSVAFFFCRSANPLFRRGPGVAAGPTHFVPDLQTQLCITPTLHLHSALLLSVRRALVSRSRSDVSHDLTNQLPPLLCNCAHKPSHIKRHTHSVHVEI